MPEKAGDVYVKIHFSSSGREFRDEVEKDKGFEEGGKAAGDKAGGGYRDAFGDKLRESLDDQEKAERKRGSIIQRETTKTTNRVGKLWDNFYKDQEDNTNNLRRSLDDIEVAWHAMSPEIANASGWTRGLADEVDDVGNSVDDSGRKTHRWSGFVHELGNRFRELGINVDGLSDHANQLSGWFAGMSDEVDHVGNSVDDSGRRTSRWSRFVQDLGDRWRGIGSGIDLLSTKTSNLSGWLAGMGGSVDEMGDSFDHSDNKARVFAYRVETLGSRIGRLKNLFSPVERLLGKMFTTDRIRRFSTSMRGIETTLGGIGKMGGKPRNDFLNIIVLGFKGIFSLASKVPGLFAKIGESITGDVAKPLEKAGEAAASAAEETAAAGEGVGSGLASISVAAPAAIAALVAVEVILGFAASAAMLMTGAVIALAAALSVALIGAVAAVAGVLLPLAAGVGAAALAFKSMDDASKKALSGAIKPLKKELGELGKVARTAFVNTLFDTHDPGIQAGRYKGVGALKDALASLKPVFRAAGRGLGDFTQELVAGFNTPGFQGFIRALSDFMPEAFRRVGRIAVNVGSFLGSVFEAVIPMAREFLGWLEGLTQSWANLGEGKGGGKIAKFFQDIGPTVDHVGDAIMQVIGLIGDLIAGPGQKAGGDMFKSIADNVQRFRDFLREAKKDGSLEKFFDDAKKLARQIGNAVVNIGKFIAALDTQDNRDAVIAIARGFNHVLRASIKVAHAVEFINHWVWKLAGSHAWGTMIGGIRSVARAFKAVWTAAKWAWDHVMSAGQKAHDKLHSLFNSIGNWFGQKFRQIGQHAQAAASAISKHFTSMGNTIRNKVTAIGQWFVQMKNKVSNIDFGSIASKWGTEIVNAFRHVPGDIVSLFSGLAGKIVSQIGSINLFPKINWPSPPGWLSKLHTASGGVFSGAQMRIIGEAGPEAVVPLTGPISAVDPAVRALAAFARGVGTGGGGGGNSRPSKTIDVGGITIVTPTKDPAAVAQETMNRLVAVGY